MKSVLESVKLTINVKTYNIYYCTIGANDEQSISKNETIRVYKYGLRTNYNGIH